MMVSYIRGECMDYTKGRATGLEKIIAACGNDCAACPRYVAHPYEKTDEEYMQLKKAFFEKEMNLSN